jgi:hypothetical protein
MRRSAPNRISMPTTAPMIAGSDGAASSDQRRRQRSQDRAEGYDREHRATPEAAPRHTT